jgi:hypothetical protein
MNIVLAIVIMIVLLFGLVVFRGAPYVPSRRRDVKKAFTELYPLGPNDLLVDIGSGDGIVLREAARRGAHAVGYELNPLLVGLSQWLAQPFKHLITTHLADFWFADLPAETTIVYTFGESRDITRMYRKVQSEATRLGKSLYFMSYGFAVPDRTVLRTDGPYHLYLVEPLQRDQP